MTDEQIIEALKGSILNAERIKCKCWSIEIYKLKNALDLINRQKAEIEELKTITGIMGTRKYYRKFVDEVFKKEKGNKRMSPDFDYIYELYFQQRTEIERLGERISYMEESIDYSRKEYNRLLQKLQQVESTEVQE